MAGLYDPGPRRNRGRVGAEPAQQGGGADAVGKQRDLPAPLRYPRAGRQEALGPDQGEACGGAGIGHAGILPARGVQALRLGAVVAADQHPGMQERRYRGAQPIPRRAPRPVAIPTIIPAASSLATAFPTLRGGGSRRRSRPHSVPS